MDCDFSDFSSDEVANELEADLFDLVDAAIDLHDQWDKKVLALMSMHRGSIDQHLPTMANTVEVAPGNLCLLYGVSTSTTAIQDHGRPESGARRLALAALARVCFTQLPMCS